MRFVSQSAGIGSVGFINPEIYRDANSIASI